MCLDLTKVSEIDVYYSAKGSDFALLQPTTKILMLPGNESMIVHGMGDGKEFGAHICL